MLPDIFAMQIAQTPFIYNFSGVEPDYKACRLSEAVKERIWRSYTDNPEPVTIDRLAREYRIRKQRVHAIIWLKDIEKQEEAAQGTPLEKDIEEYFERIDGYVYSPQLYSLVWDVQNIVCDILVRLFAQMQVALSGDKHV